MIDKKNPALKIGVLALIVLAVVGIFIFKTVNKKDEVTTPTTSQTQSGDSVSYPLKITKIDIKKVKAYSIPTVIDFGSDSCKPCQAMAPVLEKLNAEWQGKAAVQFIDVWKYTDGVNDFPVSVIPTQVFFNANGTPYVPSDRILNSIGGFTMYSDKTSGEHIFTVHQGGITEEQMRAIFAEMGVK